MSRPSDAPESPADAGADRPTTSPDDAVGQATMPEIDLRPALERLRIERRILSDERSAFRRFCDRLLAIEDDSVSPETILAHYRGTVMTVPHYWTEYGDTATESIAAEFGGTLARDLEVRDRVGDPTVTALRRAGERSLQVRDDLVDCIDSERHAVATAAEELETIRRELLALDVDGSPVGDGGTGATRLTLASIRERCDAIARRRREQLQPDDQHREADCTLPGTDDPVGDLEGQGELPPGRLQSLCYRELEADWPVLAGVEALREAIEGRRRVVLDRESER